MSTKRVGGLADIVFPPRCLACDALLDGETFFCDGCGGLVEETPAERCSRCGEPGRFASGDCPRCAAAPPPFAAAFAPFEHAGSVARAIHRFKYEDHPELAGPLVALALQPAQDFFSGEPGVVCPVPLHAARFRARKYDQATLLAVALAERLAWPLEDGWLSRTRDTQRQVGLTDAQRDANVAGAFTCEGGAKGKAVLLVDDVFTTGATARAAARALTQAGAARVSVWCVARAFRDAR